MIDVHAHVIPRSLIEFLARFGRGQVPPGLPTATDSERDVEARIERMDEAGVRTQILSPPPAVYLQNEPDAIEAARLANDAQTELVRKYPGRFAAYISLPLPHVDASLKELVRGLDHLGMAGVTMLCSVIDKSVADPTFDPIYEEMNRRGTVLFFHPCLTGICSPMINDFGLAHPVGPLLEDTVAVLHLIVRRIPSRFPNIRMIVPHFGGALPLMLERLDHQLPWHHPMLSEAPSITAKRFWYDTVAHGSQTALSCACRAFGAERLVPGSDYPVQLVHGHYRDAFTYIEHSALAPKEIDLILHRNARVLFPAFPP